MASKPDTNQRMIVKKLTSNFREAVVIENSKMCHPGKHQICVRNKYVGINATDVNLTKGRYFTDGIPPFGVGFEGVGEIVEVGSDVKHLKVGQSVAYLNSLLNAYAEYTCVAAAEAFPIAELKPDYLVLLVSGLTASIGLDKSARIMAKETVLITAGAGGLGHICVQWAKAADCHVIATCSSGEKEKVLKDLGCDRVINYKTEDLGEVLSKEYPKGIDVIWETIGGKVFDTCLKNLAVRGRLIIIGGIEGYKSENKKAIPSVDLSALPETLLLKSATVSGFLVLNYVECYGTYLKYLFESMESKKLKTIVDDGEKSTGEAFVGLEGIIKAVEYLHSGKSIGKVIARIY